MLFIIYLSVTCIVGIWMAYSLNRYFSRKKLLKTGRVTTGVVIKAEKVKNNIKIEKDEDIYKIRAEYTVDGKTYTTSMAYSTSECDLAVGQAIKIFYNEKQPSKAVPERYAEADNVNRMSVILWIVFFFACVAITAITMPSLLYMSKEEERLYSIIMHSFFAVLLFFYLVIIRRTEAYNKEYEKDPKTMKKNNVVSIGIFLNCILQVIIEIVFK